MLAKILGIFLIVIGGSIALDTIFPFIGIIFDLIGSFFGLVVVFLKFAVSLVLLYVGYRLVVQDRNPGIMY